MKIGDQLVLARKRQQLTQQQVADQIHVARQTISSWETGRSYPDIASLITLSELYHTALDDLLKGDQAMIEDLKKKEAELKQSRQIYWASLMVDILLVIVLGMAVLKTRSFELGSGQILMISMITLANLVVLMNATSRYRQLTKQQPVAASHYGITLLIILILVNGVAIYWRGLDAWTVGVLTGTSVTAVVVWLSALLGRNSK